MIFKANALTSINQELCNADEIKLNEIVDKEWTNFKVNFNRNYKSSSEEARRKELFVKNFAQIRAHNCDIKKKFTKGVNEFSDWTEEEFKDLFGFGR